MSRPAQDPPRRVVLEGAIAETLDDWRPTAPPITTKIFQSHRAQTLENFPVVLKVPGCAARSESDSTKDIIHMITFM